MVDDKIGKGEVGRQCAETSGVQIVWSKALRTTAGTAKWKANRHVGPDGQTVYSRHRAVIQLSEKVVDCEGMSSWVHALHDYSRLIYAA